MTVPGQLPVESINTNDDEARAWLAGTRTSQEVDAQIAGLSNYFASQTGGKGGGKK